MTFSYKNHDEKVLFDDVSLQIDGKWKLGVVGRNGRGKTSLLKLIAGDIILDSGNIQTDMSIEYFPYDYYSKYSNTLDVIKECIGELKSLEENLDDPVCLEKYLALDGFAVESRIKRELFQMGIEQKILERDFDMLSGGEKTKILLIALFIKNNSFILLDEPTNHLDIDGKNDLINYLKKKQGFMVVSHDIELLDSVIDHIISINKNNIELVKGNYSSWKSNFDIREEYEFRTKNNLEKNIKRLEKQATTVRNWAVISNAQKYHFASNSRTNGSQAYMTQAKNAERRINDEIELKNKLLLNYEEFNEFEFYQENINRELLIKAEKMSFSYGVELIIKNLSFTFKKGDILWVKGKNGAGKTTLLNIIYEKKKASGIWFSPDLKCTMLKQEPVFQGDETGIGFLKRDLLSDEFTESIELCKTFGFPVERIDCIWKNFSLGERKKLHVAKTLSKSNNVLLLDEPLNYMDSFFKQQLESAIERLRPTLIFVDHDCKFGEKIATVSIELK